MQEEVYPETIPVIRLMMARMALDQKGLAKFLGVSESTASRSLDERRGPSRRFLNTLLLGASPTDEESEPLLRALGRSAEAERVRARIAACDRYRRQLRSAVGAAEQKIVIDAIDAALGDEATIERLASSREIVDSAAIDEEAGHDR